MIATAMTAEEFANVRLDLPEAGRWHELHDGKPVLLDAPDDQHGNVVMNISRAFATWLQSQEADVCGYACHEVGLHVGSGPDTVLVPAMSYFDEGERFSQSDRVIADQQPRLVIDIASSNDRRQLMRERTLLYHHHGVEMIWIPDPFKREIQVLQRAQHTLALGERQKLSGGSVLPGFEIPVPEVFAQPTWWTSAPTESTGL